MNSPLPVNPNATKEARELLEYLYSIQGKFTLSGEHNQMWHMSEMSEEAQRITGKYPAVWGGEWGFSDERHDIDNIAYRPRLLDEIRKQHAAGRLICITYHQASPTIGEPCEFDPGVILNLTDEEWDELQTPGTTLYKVWEEHVDKLAAAFATLQEEGIPIVFRPYHEMNGVWFWWGGDAVRFKALWEMLYDRYVNHFGLHNLLWAWTCDRPWPGVQDFYPESLTVDILGTDIYPLKDVEEVFPQEWYERMQNLADGKPLSLSEFGKLPNEEEFAKQRFVWFLGWDNLLLKDNSEEELRRRFQDPTVISDRLPYRK